MLEIKGIFLPYYGNYRVVYLITMQVAREQLTNSPPPLLVEIW